MWCCDQRSVTSSTWKVDQSGKTFIRLADIIQARTKNRRGSLMSKSRRQFLAELSIGIVGAGVASAGYAQQPTPQGTPEPAPGTPPAFGTAPPVGPEVSTNTFSEAEKIMRVELTASERAQAAGNWRSAMAPLYERRTGPNKVSIEPTIAPYSQWNPVLPGENAGPSGDQFIWSRSDPGPLPTRDEDIAFAPVTRLARWI